MRQRCADSRAHGKSQGTPNQRLIAQSQQSPRRVAGNIEWRRTDAKDLDAISNRVAPFAAELLTSRDRRRPVRACQGSQLWLAVSGPISRRSQAMVL
jgi:hypothetical protein